MPAADAPALDRPPADPDENAGPSSELASTPAPPGPRRSRYLAEPTPWRRPHLVRAAIPVVVGLVVVVVCWYGISGEVTLASQQGWLLGSLLGAVIAAFGGVYWLLTGLREVRIGQRALQADIASVMDWQIGPDGRIVAAAAKAATESVAPELVTGPGMTLAHRPDCPITRGKPVEPVTAAEAAERGLGGCGMCRDMRERSDRIDKHSAPAKAVAERREATS